MFIQRFNIRVRSEFPEANLSLVPLYLMLHPSPCVIMFLNNSLFYFS